MPPSYYPSLRGYFGDWEYYISTLPIQDVATRVSFAKELHTSKKLSQMIQRELKGGRATEIADYLLMEEERFFSALVVAVYGGDPEWHEFGDIKPSRGSTVRLEDLPDESRKSIGYLSFTGKEKLFAIDGQHRLAGIKKALNQDQKLVTLNDDVSVIFVSHRQSDVGMKRTRRLFTVLNKRAKPVSKGEIIALDEDDVMAICSRRLVEEHRYFKDDRILFHATNNLPAEDLSSLTTLGNLYDVLTVLYSKAHGIKPTKKLQVKRPPETELEEYYLFACEYFELLSKAYPPLKQYFHSRKPSNIIAKHRGAHGGHVVFRPAGLKVLTEVVAQLCIKHGYDLSTAVGRLRELPVDLTAVPYEGLLWDSGKATMAMPLKGPLTRNLLLYMLTGEGDVKHLANRYGRALGMPAKGKALLDALPRC